MYVITRYFSPNKTKLRLRNFEIEAIQYIKEWRQVKQNQIKANVPYQEDCIPERMKERQRDYRENETERSERLQRLQREILALIIYREEGSGFVVTAGPGVIDS